MGSIGSRFAIRAAILLLMAIPGCRPARGPAAPCAVDGARLPPAPVWPSPPDWEIRSIPKPINGWIGSIALSPDGTEAVYSNAPAGDFIPTEDGVMLMRIDLGPEANPSLVELPGDALRNFASLSWTANGVAWAHWSAVGVAWPAKGSVRVLRTIPKPPGEEKRPTFPLHTSVAWAPGGDCLAATVEQPGNRTEAFAWKTAGAKTDSHSREIAPYETIAAWLPEGLLLVRTTGGSPATARTLNLPSGEERPAHAPPRSAQAFTWIGGGWLAIDEAGVVRHHPAAIAPPGAAIASAAAPSAPIAAVPPSLVAKPGDKHKFLRIAAAANGRALAVEEAVIAKGKNERHMHILTVRGGG